MFADQLPKESDLRTTNLTSSIAPFCRHSSSVTENLCERKYFLCGGGLTHSAPHRSRLCVRIPGGDQQLRLIRLQRTRWSGPRRPPHKASFRESLLGQYKPLTVKLKEFDGSRAAATEHEQVPSILHPSRRCLSLSRDLDLFFMTIFLSVRRSVAEMVRHIDIRFCNWNAD